MARQKVALHHCSAASPYFPGQTQFCNGVSKQSSPYCVFAQDIKYEKHEEHRGADKSLARPRRKKATATEDFGVHISYL